MFNYAQEKYRIYSEFKQHKMDLHNVDKKSLGELECEYVLSKSIMSVLENYH